MSTLKVNALRHNSATSDAITTHSDGTVTARLANRQGKNLIINGDMTVAQRTTSVVSLANGYKAVDRFRHSSAGLDAGPTHEQVDVASGTTPYTLGFRKSYKLTNGDQSGGAGTSDRFQTTYAIEAQDISASGWNYTSSSSYITFSFWCKSSVAQNFYGHLLTQDGTQQSYPFETGSLSANTWTKVTKIIPGNSSIQIDNDNHTGLKIHWDLFEGTDLTDSGVSLNQWGEYSATAKTPNQTSTWYTTNDATFELTGVQLEVGSNASEFDHLPFHENLRNCQRYYHKSGNILTGSEWFPGVATNANVGKVMCPCVHDVEDRAIPVGSFPTTMRSAPTLVFYPARSDETNTSNRISKYNGSNNLTFSTAPTGACNHMQGYFTGISETRDAFTFQYTADSEL